MALRADVVVIGDGAAANAALITLGKASPALDILHVTRGEEARRPGVGEHLSSPGVAVLEDLGLEPSFRAQGHLETHASYSAWGSALLQERNSLGDPDATGWCVDRERFDSWLRRQARERCCFRRLEATVERARLDPRGDGGVRVRLRGGERLRARFVLDGSGRSAAVARHLTVRRRLDRLIAVYNVYEQVDPGVQPTAGPLVEAMPSGWLYSALRPDRRLVVLWFTDGDLLHSVPLGGFKGGKDSLSSPLLCASSVRDPALPKRASAFREALLASVYTRRRIETAGYAIKRALLEVPAVADASTWLSDKVAGPGWAALGDAAGAFDPLSSHGLTAALWSGRRAALGLIRPATDEGRELAEYARSCSRGFDRYRTQRLALYRSERRYDGLFWQRRKGPQNIKRWLRGAPYPYRSAAKNFGR